MIEVDLEQYDNSVDKKLDVVIQKEDEIISLIGSAETTLNSIKESL